VFTPSTSLAKKTQSKSPLPELMEDDSDSSTSSPLEPEPASKKEGKKAAAAKVQLAAMKRNPPCKKRANGFWHLCYWHFEFFLRLSFVLFH
jgi:hypothetical protein